MIDNVVGLTAIRIVAEGLYGLAQRRGDAELATLAEFAGSIRRTVRRESETPDP